MFSYTLFNVIKGSHIWNGLHIMPAAQSGGGKSMQQKSDRGVDRASHASRKTERSVTGHSGSSKEQRKLQAEDDCVVLLCRD